MYPHRIRLRGPWELAQPPGSPPRPIRVPGRFADWGVPAGPVEARLTRAFGLPRRIDDYERVWLTAHGFGEGTAFSLNDVRVGEASETFECEVTPFLRERNQVRLDVHSATTAGGLWGELALEIRRTAYLADVRLEGGELRGAVCGTSAEPLELYLDADGRNVHYEVLGPIDGRRAWAFPLPAETRTARAQLIGGAVVWWEGETQSR